MHDLYLSDSLVLGHVIFSFSADAWIITEGVMEGIGGIVGDKIEKIVDEKGKRPIAVLSICNWGCIRDKHCLLNNYTGNSCIKTVLPRIFT